MMMWVLKLYFYVCAYTCTGIHSDQKKVLDSLELEICLVKSFEIPIVGARK